MKTQTIIAVGIVVVLSIIAVAVLSEGKIDIPGISGWRAEVTVETEYAWNTTKSVKIKNVTIYKGLEILSFSPLLFEQDWKLEVTSLRGENIVDRVIKGITIPWNSAQTHIVSVGLGDSPYGVTIRVRVYYSDGTLIDEDTARL